MKKIPDFRPFLFLIFQGSLGIWLLLPAIGYFYVIAINLIFIACFLSLILKKHTEQYFLVRNFKDEVKNFIESNGLSTHEIKQLINNGIGFIPNTNHEFLILKSNPRYVSNCWDNKIKFIDLYTCRTRSFVIVHSFDSKFPAKIRELKCIWLYQNGTLLTEVLTNKSNRYFVLFQLSRKRETCHFVKNKRFPFYYEDFVMNESDKKQFILSNHAVAILYHYKTGQKDLFEKNRQIELSENYDCLKLSGNLLSGLFQEDGRVDKEFCYWQADLNVSTQKVIKFQFHFENEQDFNDCNLRFIKKYSWSKNICYVWPYSCGSNHHLFAFDVDLQNCVKLQTFYFKVIPTFGILNDNQLIYQSDKRYFCKLPLRRPEKLTHIAWFKIQRHEMLYKKSKYGKVLKNLTLNDKELQPFHDFFK